MYFNENDKEMLDGSINIMRQIYRRVRQISPLDAITHLSQFDEDTRRKYARKDRKDTMLFDIRVENQISVGDNAVEKGMSGHLGECLSVYDKQGVVITEECGRVPRDHRIEHDTPVYISDPVDGSSYFEDIIDRLNDEKTSLIGDVFEREVNEVGEKQAKRHAPNTSVTLLKDNQIKYSIVMNFLTGDIYIGNPEGVFRGNINKINSYEDISDPVDFKDDEELTMLCYTKEGRYENNRKGTHLRFFDLHSDSKAEIGPIGPLRFTNLVKFEDGYDPGVGVVAHNGEKIQEILPNISMALFSDQNDQEEKEVLKAYKLFCDPNYIEERSGKEMTPNLRNSLYSDNLLHNSGVENEFLNNYDYPSQFRDTTAIISAENSPALTMLTGLVDRDYAVEIV